MFCRVYWEQYFTCRKTHLQSTQEVKHYSPLPEIMNQIRTITGLKTWLHMNDPSQVNTHTQSRPYTKNKLHALVSIKNYLIKGKGSLDESL